jgi:RNA polymerase sigma factor (sigma-70 family)
MNYLKKLYAVDPAQDTLHEIKLVRDALVLSNSRLASYSVPKAQKRYDMGAGLSTAFLALMKAVDGYDYMKGNDFTTYAMNAIRYEFIGEFKARQRSVSASVELDNQTDDANGIEVADYRGTDDSNETVNRIGKYLSELDSRSRDMVESSYGIYREKETYEQIGQRYNVSKQRVEQIIKKSVHQLSRLVEA